MFCFSPAFFSCILSAILVSPVYSIPSTSTFHPVTLLIFSTFGGKISCISFSICTLRTESFFASCSAFSKSKGKPFSSCVLISLAKLCSSSNAFGDTLFLMRCLYRSKVSFTSWEQYCCISGLKLSQAPSCFE